MAPSSQGVSQVIRRSCSRSRLFTRNQGGKQRGPASKATAGPYGDDAAQTARQHMVWRLRSGELASTRPQNHSSVIKYGVNTKLHRASQGGTGGDPPHLHASHTWTGKCVDLATDGGGLKISVLHLVKGRKIPCFFTFLLKKCSWVYLKSVHLGSWVIKLSILWESR